jgi:hypothetical protein
LPATRNAVFEVNPSHVDALEFLPPTVEGSHNVREVEMGLVVCSAQIRIVHNHSWLSRGFGHEKRILDTIDWRLD